MAPSSVVPVFFHNSAPLAIKYKLPTLVRLDGDKLHSSRATSLTKTVPKGVPLLFHNSIPLLGVLASKNNVPLTLVSPVGFSLAISEGKDSKRARLTIYACLRRINRIYLQSERYRHGKRT